MTPATVGSSNVVRVNSESVRPTGAMVTFGPHIKVHVSGLQKTITAPTGGAPEMTSSLERVSSTTEEIVSRLVGATVTFRPHIKVRISGLQKTLNAPTDAAPEKTSLLERVSSTAGEMVPVAASPIGEMESMLTAVTQAGEREREERAKADEATSALMAALIKSNQELARKNETLEKRVILLESAQRGSDIIHRSVLQASESRRHTEVQALQAKVGDLEVRLDFALKEPPHLRLARWIEENKRISVVGVRFR